MRKLAVAGAALAIVALGHAGAAEEAGRFTWDHEGYARLPDAATAARESGRRLLLGLSGSPT